MSKKIAAICALSSAAMIPTGLIIAKHTSWQASFEIGILLIVLGAPVLTIAAIAVNGTFNQRQKKTVKIYNGLYQKYKDKEASLQLSFGLAQNGIGFFVVF